MSPFLASCFLPGVAGKAFREEAPSLLEYPSNIILLPGVFSDNKEALPERPRAQLGPGPHHLTEGCLCCVYHITAHGKSVPAATTSSPQVLHFLALTQPECHQLLSSWM